MEEIKPNVPIPGDLSCEWEDSFEFLCYDRWRHVLWKELSWHWKVLTFLLYSYKFHDIKACKTGRVRHPECEMEPSE